MGEYLSPGVYVEEMPGSQPVQAAGTSTAAFVGLTKRGPLNKATFITNFGEFETIFGGFFDNITEDDIAPKQAYLPYAVRAFFDNGGGRCYVVRTANGAGFAQQAGTIATTKTGASLKFKPASEGKWSEGLKVRIQQTVSDASVKPIKAAIDAGTGTIDTLGNLEFFSVSVIKTIKDLEGNDKEIVLDFIDDLNLDPLSANYVDTRITGVSNLLSVEASGFAKGDKVTIVEETVNAGTTDEETKYRKTVTFDTSGSNGSTLNSTHYTAEGKGLKALDKVEEINMLIVPDAHNAAKADIKGIQIAAKGYADNRGDCIFITESLYDKAGYNLSDVIATRQNLASNNTAFYTPWVAVTDVVNGSKKLVPPAGHMAGIYARTDKNRGVFKAPAGTMDGGINGILGLEATINKAKQTQLNPVGINCLREMPNVGNVVWGARTTAADAQWRYISVRRLILFIEKSLEKAAMSAVFEPNDANLWGRIRRDFSGFLRGIWSEGGLFGKTEEEAFFVKIDEENNPQSSRDAGKLIINIGVAPVKPAEFVIIRIEQTQNS